MKKIIWTDDFSVGVNSIDEQHKKIIELINTLINLKNESVESQKIYNVLQEMMLYAQKHLDYEESMLEEHGYPNLMQHASVHVKYIKRVSELSFAIMAQDNQAPEKLLLFLQDWWVHHILYDDMQYRSFCEQKEVS
jgi:hemerythrin-like metal-binding protein